MDYVAGIDLGGTKIYSALADLDGNILCESKVPTESWRGYEGVVERMAAAIRDLQREARLVHHGRLLAVGVGAPGPLDSNTGVVYQAPNLGWRDVPLGKNLESLLATPVFVENDANLGALGEHAFGAGRGSRDMVYVTVSTGIGGGLILDGHLYRGAGMGAGEIGHMTVLSDGPRCRCGNKGCLEAVASGTAIARRARREAGAGTAPVILELAGGDPGKITAVTVAEAASRGDERALDILTGAARFIGIGLANLVNLLNPSVIVLGGGVMESGRLFWQVMDEEMRERALERACQTVRLVPTALGPRVGVVGAIALALQRARDGQD
ncbi:MAG: ROK family glucokinase [Peptococcaceae bacterium]|nr:ROK family glucokinase [Peptococcaceae bacterium]